MHAGLGRLHRIALVVNRRRRAGEIEDLVDLDIEREGHVVADQLEALVIQQMLDVAARAAEEIIDADDVGCPRKEVARKDASRENQIRRSPISVAQDASRETLCTGIVHTAEFCVRSDENDCLIVIYVHKM